MRICRGDGTLPAMKCILNCKQKRLRVGVEGMIGGDFGEAGMLGAPNFKPLVLLLTSS